MNDYDGEAMIEAMAKAAYQASAPLWPWKERPDAVRNHWRIYARAALAVAEPLIRADEREACAKVAETHEWFVGGIGTVAPGSGESRAIAAAIRARGDGR